MFHRLPFASFDPTPAHAHARAERGEWRGSDDERRSERPGSRQTTGRDSRSTNRSRDRDLEQRRDHRRVHYSKEDLSHLYRHPERRGHDRQRQDGHRRRGDFREEVEEVTEDSEPDSEDDDEEEEEEEDYKRSKKNRIAGFFGMKKRRKGDKRELQDTYHEADEQRSRRYDNNKPERREEYKPQYAKNSYSHHHHQQSKSSAVPEASLPSCLSPAWVQGTQDNQPSSLPGSFLARRRKTRFSSLYSICIGPVPGANPDIYSSGLDKHSRDDCMFLYLNVVSPRFLQDTSAVFS